MKEFLVQSVKYPRSVSIIFCFGFVFSVQLADEKHVETEGWSNKMEDQDHHCLSHTLSLCKNSRFVLLLANLKCTAKQQMHMYPRVIANGSDLYSSNCD